MKQLAARDPAENRAAGRGLTAVGIDLRPMAAHVTGCRGDVEHGDTAVMQPFLHDRPCEARIPPAMILPLRARVPARLDVALPPHPRGTGAFWPPEARVKAPGNGGVGRLPIALAWRKLLAGESTPWEWQPSIPGALAQVAMEPAQAVANAWTSLTRNAAALQPGDDDSTRGRAVPSVLVVPNCLTESQQDSLFHEAERLGDVSTLRLLWRPVAAVWLWCERFRSYLESRISEETSDHDGVADVVLGRVVSLHLGLVEWEITDLQIVGRKRGGRWFFLPARPRPMRGSTLPSPGLRATSLLAWKALEAWGLISQVGALWRLLWTTSFAELAIRAISLDNCDVPSVESTPDGTCDCWPYKMLSPDQIRRHWSEVRGKVAGCRIPDGLTDEPFGRELTCGPSGKDVSKWLEAAAGRDGSGGPPLLGAIVSGPLAAVHWGGEEPFGVRQLRKCGATPDSKRIMVERIDFEATEIASVAARYAAYLAAGLPTYLDTLPRLRIGASRKGVPTWEPLLEQEDKFVDGGKIWTREDPIRGLFIKAGEQELRIPLDHEDHPTVREAKVTLTEAPSERVPVQLKVTMEPARGNARLQVVCDRPELLPHRRVFADLLRMGDTGRTPTEWLDEQPQAFPSHFPRRSSPVCWTGGYLFREIEGAADAIERFLNRPTPTNLDDVKKELLRQDRSHEDGWEYRAVDSDGIPAGDEPEDWRLLQELVGFLVKRLKSPGQLRTQDIVRVLADTSTSNLAVQGYLANCIRNMGPGLKQEHLAACGWCLRDPDTIGEFARQAFILRLKQDLRGLANWTKAFWEILRYRPDATRDIASEDCEYIAGDLLLLFQQQLRRTNFKFAFRYASGGIAYLLRRRAFDEQFLDPETELAKKIKAAFRRAMQEVRQHPENVIGGSIRIDQQLQLIIDYIDRRGTGLIVIGVDLG